jgi:hypothetical protein
MSLTQTAKSTEKAMIRERRRAVGAESAVRSGGTSVKGRKNGTARSSQKVYEFEKNASEWNRRTGAAQETRSLGGTEKRIHTPDVMDDPKRTS